MKFHSITITQCAQPPRAIHKSSVRRLRLCKIDKVCIDLTRKAGLRVYLIDPWVGRVASRVGWVASVRARARNNRRPPCRLQCPMPPCSRANFYNRTYYYVRPQNKINRPFWVTNDLLFKYFVITNILYIFIGTWSNTLFFTRFART